MRGPAYWRHLAEEHGDCLRDFMEAGVQPALCYEQAVIAAHFARLYLEATVPPELEAPEPGERCPRCETPTEVVGFCGVCEESKPMTLAAFLKYAAESTVNR